MKRHSILDAYDYVKELLNAHKQPLDDSMMDKMDLDFKPILRKTATA